MKRNYEPPFAEKIEFNYTETVVASDPGENHGDKGGGVSITDRGCNRVPGHDAANQKNGTCGNGKTKNKKC